MQTDKYTKVVLTLIAVGIFSLGCGGGASLEEVNELRQEVAGLKEAVEQNEVEELRQEVAGLKEAVEQNEVEELRQEVAALRDSVDRGVNKIALESLLAPFKVSDMVRTKRLEIVNGDGEAVIYAGTADNGSGLLSVSNKSGQGVIYAGTGDGDDGDGLLLVKNKSGQEVIYAGNSNNGNGGYLRVKNKAGEGVISLKVDDYGNGVVGAWNRWGKGRTLESK